MRYGVYYALYERGQAVASDSPVDLEPKDIRSDILPAMDGDGDFMGLIDAHGTALQFIYHQGGDRFWVEIPLLNEKASHGRWMSFDACVELLENLPEIFSIKAFPGFEYQSWQIQRPPD